MTSQLKRDVGVMSKRSISEICAIGITKPLQFLLHFIFDMELSFLQYVWPPSGLKSNAINIYKYTKYCINTKPKYMATVTALEHFCLFSKVENLTRRFLGQLELLYGGETL